MRYFIGIGNYSMGDDGIGLHLVEYVVRHHLDQNFEAIDLSGDALRLLNYFVETTEKILIADCITMNRDPGDFVLFSPDEVQTKKELSHLTTHESDVLSVLEMGRQLGLHIPPIKILGIEPEKLQPAMHLSEKLDALQQGLAEIITSELTR